MQTRISTLIIASPEDTKRYEDSGCYSGLPEQLSFLAGDITAIAERVDVKGYDHVHLSISNQYKHLVRWQGRGQSGYHYPIGRVMVILNQADVLYPDRVTSP